MVFIISHGCYIQFSCIAVALYNSDLAMHQHVLRNYMYMQYLFIDK